MSILDTAVSRTPLGEHDGRSGGALERVVLADGRRLVVKRTTFAADLTRRLTGDAEGREYALWRHGVLDRLGPVHAVVDGWRDGDETVVVMRDLGSAVVGWDRVLTHAEVSRLLAAAIAVHRADHAAPPELLVPIRTRVSFFAPARVEPLAAEFPLAAAVVEGWTHFAELADTDVAGPVLALLDDPAPLAEALAARHCTLIHGDLWPVNTAFTGDGVVLLDWNLAGWAPPALDLMSLLAGAGAANLAISREEAIEEFRGLCGAAHDEPALRLALLCGLVEYGWNKALDAATDSDPGRRERHRADLDWWISQARAGLRHLS
ncbi:aminoglycoside phosphotransferase family protein [Micromonospora sp. CPCC 205371]|nr:aminoglycoside phosphotransferase family protein [Micromonospora sp. CPCC 205371]